MAVGETVAVRDTEGVEVGETVTVGVAQDESLQPPAILVYSLVSKVFDKPCPENKAITL